MNYIKEITQHTGYCGSYCRICDWHTGKLRRQFSELLDTWDEYGGFAKQMKEKVDGENLRKGIMIIASSTVCSGCKTESEGAGDRCSIRLCAYEKGIILCNECEDYFECATLRENPGVIKFNCIENLNEIRTEGAKTWIDSCWEEYFKS